MNKRIIESLRARFPRGCRVELVRMDDPQAPPIRTRGTVIGVDDIGTIHVSWDNAAAWEWPTVRMRAGGLTMDKIMAGEIGPVEQITKFGETWYIQEFYRPDGNLEAVSLYNCFGEFETEQPDQDALEEWFLDNIVNGR